MFSRRTAWDVSPNRLAHARMHHQRCGRTALDLSCSNPTAVELAYPEEFYAELFDARAMAYEPEPFGLRAGRDAVAEHYYRRRGHRVSGERVCLTASTSEAYAHLLSLLCDPGDIVLVPSPSYPLLDYLAELARIELVTYPVNYDGHWWVDTDSLAKLAREHGPRVKAVICVAPNNPTGSYLTHEELGAIESLCTNAELALIVDEVFSDYPLYPGPRRVGSVVGERECLTFVLSGLSKVAALPQFKLAWTVACGPEELVRPALARLSVIADTYLNLATPVQLALPKIFAASESMQGQIRARALTNLQTLDAAITDSPISRLSVEAGWSTILRLPRLGELDDEGWVLRMLERIDLWAQPGSLYDIPGCHLVISLLTQPQEFAEGLTRAVACVEQVCRC
ncbi:Glutamate-pyruvate aminotransferase AlaA [Enhygromyxa salina]|uniref:alanine transaminase n=1 Tax=Enhygromyxa salina TaxID=215803 RepID=A0A2S9XMV7_9BACT|nr:pyridoxal phosphate-dependent aminotransferase [Enhygromyxa salina]PRP94182.1 Glutamate-pyruvate aminotransferase AlaA [Enhygromyxa salina]